MEPNIFWDVFRDTGDPLCWLMTRLSESRPAEKKEESDREDKPSLS